MALAVSFLQMPHSTLSIPNFNTGISATCKITHPSHIGLSKQLFYPDKITVPLAPGDVDKDESSKLEKMPYDSENLVQFSYEGMVEYSWSLTDHNACNRVVRYQN